MARAQTVEDLGPTASEADALAKLDVLRSQIRSLEAKQRQHERLLESWRRAAATAAADAAVREGMLAAEIFQLEHDATAQQHARRLSGIQDTQLRRREQEAHETLEARERELVATIDELKRELESLDEESVTADPYMAADAVPKPLKDVGEGFQSRARYNA